MWGSLVVLLASAIAAVVVLRRRFAIVEVLGASMEPTLKQGDRVVIRRFTQARRSRGLRVGDIVVLREAPPGCVAPSARIGPRPRWVIKRVVAVPGEPVPTWFDGVLAKDVGRPVPTDQMVVIGDNPHRSVDSRALGYIPIANVSGVMIRRLASSRSEVRRTPLANSG